MGKILAGDQILNKAVAQIQALGWVETVRVYSLPSESSDYLVIGLIGPDGREEPVYSLQSVVRNGQQYWYARQQCWVRETEAVEYDEALLAAWQYIAQCKVERA